MRKNADTLLVATVLFVSALGSGLAWYRQCLRAPMVLAASPGYLAAEQAEETIYQIYRRTYRTYSRTSGEPIDEGTLHLYGAVTCGITSFVYLFVLAAPFFSVMPTFVSPGGPGKYCSFAVPSWLTFFACSRSRWQCSPSNHEVPPCGPRQGAAHRPPPRGASDGVVARHFACRRRGISTFRVVSTSIGHN